MAAHRLYPLWVQCAGRRSAERSRRGKIGSPDNDVIDNNFLQYQWDEVFEADLEEFSRVRVEDKPGLYENKIVGMILIMFSGSWDGPLSEFGGEQRCMQLGLALFYTCSY